MPKVLNFKDCGHKVPEGAVYIGRAVPRYQLAASQWANPFRIGVLTREETIVLYKNAILWGFDPNVVKRLTDHQFQQEVFEVWQRFEKHHPKLYDMSALKGFDLVCWCAPQACHGDILLSLANGEGKLLVATAEIARLKGRP